jgi:hypothetical protein
MKTIAKLFLLVVFVLIVFPILALGFMGFIPGLSNVLGANKARDLGIKYTEADRISGRSKSQIEYGEIKEIVSPEESAITSGSRIVKSEFTSQEVTALMNNRPWKYWPYKNVQVKFNADGSGELSGNLIKDRMPGYLTFAGVPEQVITIAMNVLPDNTSFYVKMRASLVNNQIELFEPQSFSIGRVPLPVNMFLSFAYPSIVNEVHADSFSDLKDELGKVSNKRDLIIDFLNQRISLITGFYAKNARFGDNKLIFDGNLPEKESAVK